jgi:hypothetical protein
MIDSFSLLLEVFQSGLVPALFRSPFFDLNNYNTEFEFLDFTLLVPGTENTGIQEKSRHFFLFCA